MTRRPPSALPALTLVTALVTLSAAGGELDFDLLFADGAGGRVPSQITWSPDGSQLSYVWDDGEGEALWVLDARSHDARKLLPLSELELDDHTWAPDGRSLILETADAAHWLSLDGGGRRPLTDDGGETAPTFAPSGDRVAFVRDFDLHWVDLASGEVRALTEGGEEGVLLHGVTDWVYWEELWGRDSTGFWWSPSGDAIAFYQFDETAVSRVPIVDSQPAVPEVRWQRYPKAGGVLPEVRLGVADVETGAIQWLETGPVADSYLARVHWSPAGDRVIVTRLDRDQTRLDLLACDPRSGGCTPWMSERWPTWINLHDDFRWRADGGFLWSSEKEGHRALYLHGADGRQLRRLSPPSLAVGAVRAFDDDAGWVLYDAWTIGPLGALHRAVYRQALDGSPPVALTPLEGTHSAIASDAGLWVHTWSRADDPRQIAVRDLDGAEIAPLPAAPPLGFDPAALPRWEFFTLPGPDGEALPAAVLKPPELDPRRRYPVIMYHYGCPASQVVRDAWGSRARGLWHKMMAERGYVVLMVDNLASTFFGKHGEDRAHRAFGPGNLAAQRAAVDHLRRQPWADVERIGLWGWSGGGYNTLYALTHAPGVWRAGVAGAPVSDWKYYDAIWTERYMDAPQDNPDGYAAASAVDAADQLEDALLIIHGTADDNVHPQNTLAMSAALIAAGKPFEQAIHPGQRHGFRGDDMRHVYERMTAFFDRHLAGSGADPRPASSGSPR